MPKKFAFLFLLFCVSASAQDPIADSLLRVLRSTTSDTARISLYYALSGIPSLEKSRALGYADSAFILSRNTTDYIYQAIPFRAKGNIFYRRSENDSALHYLGQALRIYSAHSDHLRMATVQYHMGNALSASDRSAEAQVTYIECEKNAERAHSPLYVAYAKNGLGTIQFDVKNYASSQRYHTEALALALPTGDNKVIGWTYTNLGNCYVQLNDYTKAQENFELSLAAYEKTDYVSGIAGAYNNIGVCYSYRKEYDAAIVNFKKAAEIKERIGAGHGLSIAYQNIAMLYSLEKEFDSAYVYGAKSLDFAKRSGSLEQEAQVYYTFSQVYSGAGKYDSAYKYHVLFKRYNDSVYTTETQAKVAELQAQYDSEKQQQQITLLHQEAEIGLLWRYVLAGGGGLVLLLALFVYNRYRIKTKANTLLAMQNEQITSQKKEITDSINYAKRIQQSILPSQSHFTQLLPDSFVLYRPKDIVSGDFYWIERSGNITLFAAVDCTGHGVPGAMMSVLGYNLLTEAVLERKLTRPADILRSLNAGVYRALHRQSDGESVKDGMDLTLCAIDPQAMKLEHAGVFNPLYLVRNGELTLVNADRKALGQEEEATYTSHTLDLQRGDCVYIFTDGYADQFGGPGGKKFKYSRFQQLLVANASRPMEEQKKILEKTLEEWKGNLEQVDDILVIGFRM